MHCSRRDRGTAPGELRELTDKKRSPASETFLFAIRTLATRLEICRHLLEFLFPKRGAKRSFAHPVTGQAHTKRRLQEMRRFRFLPPHRLAILVSYIYGQPRCKQTFSPPRESITCTALKDVVPFKRDAQMRPFSPACSPRFLTMNNGGRSTFNSYFNTISEERRIFKHQQLRRRVERTTVCPGEYAQTILPLPSPPLLLISPPWQEVVGALISSGIALRNLSMASNDISDAGVGSLARLLDDEPPSYRCVLSSLDLRGNSIGSRGCKVRDPGALGVCLLAPGFGDACLRGVINIQPAPLRSRATPLVDAGGPVFVFLVAAHTTVCIALLLLRFFVLCDAFHSRGQTRLRYLGIVPRNK